MAVADHSSLERSRPRRRPRLHVPSGFQVVLVLVGLAVAAAVVIPMVRLALWSWDEYGTGIPSYYWSDVFTDPVMQPIIVDTAILVTVSSFLATLVAAILAWLNERTDASIGAAGRVIPLIPFLMPAIALPLGWLFLASPNAGALNVLIRGALDGVGISLESGPLDVYSWQGLIFLYTVFLCGFGYLVISSSMRNLDSGLEEAATLSGAGPLRILFFIVLPALRPALITAFLMCLIVAVAMVSVPITIGTGANIHILSVIIVDLVANRTPPAYGQAFLLGILMLVPVLLAWALQRRSAARGRFAVIGGRASMGAHVRLGPWRRAVGRAIFLVYAFVAVVLPVLGLAYVAGVEFWSNTWPESWSPVGNVREALEDEVIRGAMRTSILLGIVTAVALVVVSQILSYGQRVFPGLGHLVDGLTKTPAVIAHVLLATALLVALGGPPFRLGGSVWLLFLAYFIFFVPFATVMTTGAQHEIGRDVVEAAKLSRASDSRTLLSVVTPLTRPALIGAFLLMFVLVSGETNGSLILASTDQPVVGFVMLDLYNFASYPKVASFALLITLVNLAAIAGFMLLLSGRGPGRRR
ncbi:MAG: ABC transporter permease subunit [Actinomycetota bacterium]